MIARSQINQLLNAIRQNPVTALLGPRQVGKTTLARKQIDAAAIGREVVYLDLENPSDQARLENPVGYLQPLLANNHLIVIDEIQRAPGLFQVLRSLVDQCIHDGSGTGHFLLLGSASIDLLRQSSESLAGRIAYLELSPLDLLEVDPTSTDQLWIRGGFPKSYLADTDSVSASWRSDFISTYLERDIPQLGPRIPAETLRRFWTMLAHRQGAPLNAADIARSLGVDGKTVASYLDLMVDLLLVRRLQPYHANVRKRLVKSPKVFIRDSGLLFNLLGLDTLDDVLGHPVSGAGWEGFVIENLLGNAPQRAVANYYRTATGNEIDLLLELPGNKCWAIEIKRSAAPTVSDGFYRALEDVQPDRSFIVYNGEERYAKADGVEAIGLAELAAILKGI